MATRKAAKARRTTARATKRKPTRSTRRAKPRESRELKEILIELGRRSLTDGVKQVLEDHGVDSSVKVEMVLRPTRTKGGRRATKVRKTTKRRTR